MRPSSGVLLRKFSRDEDGSIIVLTIILLIIMLVIGGMAVDFMRFESRRAELQSVADRAVLAGAKQTSSLAAAEQVNQYFEKAGFGDAIIGAPVVTSIAGSQSVSVNSAIDIDTFYLRFIGIDQLTAPASSAAGRTTNVEISLVLDISGSMNYLVSNGNRRMDLLKPAAVNFVNQMLGTSTDGPISISLVAYSAQVNIGEELFNALNTTPRITVDTAINPATGAPFSFENPANCIEFNDADFSATGINTGIGATPYQQVPYFQHRRFDQKSDGNGNYSSDVTVSTLDQPLCPTYDFEAIIPHSRNALELTTAINALQPRQYTSIYNGMKWGVALLDPSMRDVLAPLSMMDGQMAGVRPANYDGTADGAPTQKFVILMTDGKNVSGYVPRTRIYDSAMSTSDDVYNSAEEQIWWAEGNLPFQERRPVDEWPTSLTRIDGDGNHVLKTRRIRNPRSEAEGDILLNNICTAAKASGNPGDPNITVFTIAMGNDVAEQQMRDCASAPSSNFFFQTTSTTGASEEAAINAIFETIADQIRTLRLTQ
ncbi:Tad domain-containing protein [Yoonia sediminilitoris]|uniref:Flp pilus assembly protein TadG n=1 Tax=Yoonia sediminilitoris TaxID=1286148 RepID=A0A2T6K7X8_9RHOB|nr:Tad domain-containing protein [Yoonia sediminilitoris]PUB10839.1 Flp pilus assembly protein TadG [Yoonia sediminilitoris]RCW90514.1 Flp pilus assembly protein TadG [Yoonia sediminilitoris]